MQSRGEIAGRGDHWIRSEGLSDFMLENQICTGISWVTMAVEKVVGDAVLSSSERFGWAYRFGSHHAEYRW